MRIAIIGHGNVGSSLERGLGRHHEVRSVGKEPERVRDLARWGQIVIVAVPFRAIDAVAAELGDGANGKPLVDVTNPITPNREFAGSFERSVAETLQAKVAGAAVVKGFNTMFAEQMATGRARGQQISLFLAADALDAKQQVGELGRSIGHDVVDAGPLANARWLEALGYLNIQLGTGPSKLGRDIGFKLVH
jgi:predicted dinucleotide-binding enzyme